MNILLSMVDYYGFRRFCNNMQPLFKVMSRNTIKKDIFKIYDVEKEKTMKLLNKNWSRIAITSDLWTTSNQNKGYMTITLYRQLLGLTKSTHKVLSFKVLSFLFFNTIFVAILILFFMYN
ncbi:hypothetical protein Patl1_16481 [Pistacia atlantica]|uniref:Uncharacterized protein n=1 Tax=Pistacia atlantica TaxID=434234 RepID=A0ACC1B7Q7_9ROSI|nr:hypothetical protein Patl1_16481 [Pistacia atlantica]